MMVYVIICVGKIGGISSVGECFTGSEEVAGSSPACSINYGQRHYFSQKSER